MWTSRTRATPSEMCLCSLAGLVRLPAQLQQRPGCATIPSCWRLRRVPAVGRQQPNATRCNPCLQRHMLLYGRQRQGGLRPGVLGRLAGRVRKLPQVRQRPVVCESTNQLRRRSRHGFIGEPSCHCMRCFRSRRATAEGEEAVGGHTLPAPPRLAAASLPAPPATRHTHIRHCKVDRHAPGARSSAGAWICRWWDGSARAVARATRSTMLARG